MATLLLASGQVTSDGHTACTPTAGSLHAQTSTSGSQLSRHIWRTARGTSHPPMQQHHSRHIQVGSADEQDLNDSLLAMPHSPIQGHDRIPLHVHRELQTQAEVTKTQGSWNCHSVAHSLQGGSCRSCKQLGSRSHMTGGVPASGSWSSSGTEPDSGRCSRQQVHSSSGVAGSMSVNGSSIHTYTHAAAQQQQQHLGHLRHAADGWSSPVLHTQETRSRLAMASNRSLLGQVDGAQSASGSSSSRRQGHHQPTRSVAGWSITTDMQHPPPATSTSGKSGLARNAHFGESSSPSHASMQRVWMRPVTWSDAGMAPGAASASAKANASASGCSTPGFGSGGSRRNVLAPTLQPRTGGLAALQAASAQAALAKAAQESEQLQASRDNPYARMGTPGPVRVVDSFDYMPPGSPPLTHPRHASVTNGPLATRPFLPQHDANHPRAAQHATQLLAHPLHMVHPHHVVQTQHAQHEEVPVARKARCVIQ